MPEAVSHQPSTVEVPVRYQACPYGADVEQSGNRIGIFPSISILAYQYYSPMFRAQWLSFQRRYIVLTGDTVVNTLRTAVGSRDTTPVVRVFLLFFFFLFCRIEACFSCPAMSS